MINISVRNLVEFVLRSGSIDSRYLSTKRMADGIRIHQKIQRRRQKELSFQNLTYEAEVSLKHQFSYKDFEFVIEGRADAIVTTPGHELIEEIKSSTKELHNIEMNSEHWHWAQAKCYAYIYSLQNELTNISVNLVYCNVESLETLVFESSFSTEQLESFFYDILERYYNFAKLDFMRIQDRKESAALLKFPYAEYRKSQRELASAVYRTITRKKRLFAQAPTGTGKTISTLFPAVKALENGKIFYLTAKTLQRSIVEETLMHMDKCGLIMRSVALTAKDKICFTEGSPCNPESCIYANGHFDRVNMAIYDMISNERLMRRETLENYAQKHICCPFELSLDVSLFCDCIVCDYNYVYDPKAQLRRYFVENDSSSIVVLNDEAHNLIDRAREMFSAQISSYDFADFSVLSKKHKSFYNSIQNINEWFYGIDGGFSKDEKVKLNTELPETFLYLLKSFTVQADILLSENPNTEFNERILNLYFTVLDFLRIADLFDECYTLFIEKQNKDIVIKMLCLDPAVHLALIHKKLFASVFFSATLQPMQYFREVLGGEEGDYGIKISSPFQSSNLCILVDNSVSTKYKDRNSSLKPIAQRIYAMINAQRGNYLIFFPSYEYMNNVLAIFKETYNDININIVAQEYNMQEKDRQKFLEQFSAENKEVLLGFAVLGGIFSEGIDLVGKRLIGAAIVGVGLPLISAERNVISDYYKLKNGDGFEYAYMYPGMNKVMQAGGRVIRSETDKGVILLIDSRFTKYEYKKLLPDEWQGFIRVNNPNQIENYLLGFWNQHKEGFF